MKKVLIVEDNEDIRAIYGVFLRHFGYQVVEAVNGYDGVQAARRERPDVIVMDLSMPLLDGLEATRTLKSDARTSGIPIVVVTADVVARMRLAAEALGCSAFLPKPVAPSELLEQVERLCPREAALEV